MKAEERGKEEKTTNLNHLPNNASGGSPLHPRTALSPEVLLTYS